MKGLRKGGLIIAAIGAVSLFIGAAWAHPPFCICKMANATTVRCEGGFADGRGVPGVKLDVVRYDESIVLETKFGPDSIVSFRRPEGEFYVLFDAGPGQSFDVDYKDIQ
ncbi:hypothetical protein NB311A_13971 [Nitrobacter sp. Nb-311A]|uniref:hypothetical protein n=1 Tax=unclassified Nitrobacter TaxID=2620411 RepID=UPI000068715B|nr:MULTISPECIES: hypothetical protein [unclassified Nitrobacter]EAQ34366.1 hypothetical protein NB311A_13971 [Nitrobacter sp. Nb-311A]MCB1393768.1 hypothetical protein [Nitrobacter sp.]MCV0387753.1 hypothetical protein [Nitrobacter sp.]